MNSTNPSKQSILILSLILLGLGVAFAAGYVSRDLFNPGAGNTPILNEAYGLLEKNGLKDQPTPPALEYGMIRGMLEAYGDPYTSFYEPVQNELQSNQLAGKFGGIGVRLSQDTQGYIILYPLPDSPAAVAGVKDGDRLLAADGVQFTLQSTSDEIQAAIRGEVNTRVTLTVASLPDYKPREVSVKRAEVPLPSVTWNLSSQDATVGVIQVNIIAATTTDEIQKAVDTLKTQGASYFLLDLRNNGGGLLDSGVDISRLFLKSGEIIKQQYKDQAVKTFSVEKPGPLADLPLAVLVNGNTASAAEIIAGALQVQGRAMLIGSHTYGKDTIQMVFNLKDNSSLHVTAAKWWVPGLDHALAGVGLNPDIALPDTASDLDVLAAAIQAVKR